VLFLRDGSDRATVDVKAGFAQSNPAFVSRFIENFVRMAARIPS
jgi:hypothetical protein